MDCNHFRKHHLAYLDDTLPGDLMAQAQRHVLQCHGCAAHDTLVRRSLMLAHSLPSLEPSAEFQARLRARLAECRAEREAGLQSPSAPAANTPRRAGMASRRPFLPARTMFAVAASAVIGVLAYQALRDETVPTLAIQPVMATPPRPVPAAPYISPALVHAMATGNPVWPAAMIVEEASMGFVNTDYGFVELR